MRRTLPDTGRQAELRPHQFLETGDPYVDGGVPPDGILQGTWSSDEHAGDARDVTYSWRLVPDP
jgi:hypothetical protein